ncbi:MAG: PAS domain S-box protein [Ignavibacteriae bacterium]|nr:PAS domain S-box protein [Ignavibacteriota bacterium]
MATRVLVAASDASEAESIASTLSQPEELRCDLTMVFSLSDAIEKIRLIQFDALLLDLSIEKCTDVEAINTIRRHTSELAIIALTSASNNGLSREALRAGAQDYLYKEALDFSTLSRSLRYATERIKSERALRASEERMRMAIEAAHLGTWDWDLASDTLHWSKGHERLFGVRQFESDRSITFFEKCVHPDDLDAVRRALNYSLDHKVPFKHEYRVVWPDGSIHWIQDEGLFVCDDAGEPVRMVGIVQEQTERKQAEIALEESERRFRALFESMNELFALHELIVDESGTAKDYRMVDCNPAFTTITGIPREKAIGELASVLYGTGSAPFLDTYAEVIRTGMPTEFETYFAPLSKYFHISAFSPRAGQFAILATDVTSRELAEEQLRSAKHLYQSLLDVLPEGVSVADMRGKITFVSARLAEIYGVTDHAEGIGTSYTDWMAPESFQRAVRNMQAVIQTNVSVPHEYLLKKKDGTRFQGEITSAVLRDESGLPSGLVSIHRDVTERKRADDERKKAVEAILIQTAAMEAAANAIALVSLEGTIQWVNPAFTKLTGYSAEEAIGKNPRILQSGEHDRAFYENMWKTVTAGKTWHGEIQNRRKNGELYHEEMTITPVANDAGEIFRFIAVKQDITERKIAETERLRLAIVVDQASEIIVVTDGAGTIQYVNPAFERICGYTRAEIVGLHPRVLVVDEEENRAIWSTIESGQVWKGRTRTRKKDGSTFVREVSISPVVDERGKIINHISVGRDVTAEIELERQLLQSQKMESLGTLASGIAHDFNNILGIIMGTASMLGSDSTGSPMSRTAVESILKASQRGAGLVKQILTFARKADSELSPIHVNATLKEFVGMITNTFPRTIRIQLDLQKDLPILMLDATQLHQALLNLCVNARDAVVHDSESERKGGGEIVLRSRMTSGEVLRRTLPDVEAQQYVTIVVADNGPGMSSEVLKKIFDPFFTTKPPGQGTGLGLAVVYGIVRAHHALVEVVSSPGQGAEFLLHFPMETQTAPGVQAPEEQQAQTSCGTETLLLVEDDPMMHELIAQILQSAGYTVLLAKDGREGLELFQSQHTRIDLVITDMNMPQMNGEEFIARANVISPGTRFIVSSGYLGLGADDALGSNADVEVIQKPFQGEELRRLVRAVLDRKSKRL